MNEKPNLKPCPFCGGTDHERYQALQDIQMLGRMGANICILCEHYKHGEGSAACVTCPKMDNFKWRGVPAKEG